MADFYKVSVDALVGHTPIDIKSDNVCLNTYSRVDISQIENRSALVRQNKKLLTIVLRLEREINMIKSELEKSSIS